MGEKERYVSAFMYVRDCNIIFVNCFYCISNSFSLLCFEYRIEIRKGLNTRTSHFLRYGRCIYLCVSARVWDYNIIFVNCYTVFRILFLVTFWNTELRFTKGKTHKSLSSYRWCRICQPESQINCGEMVRIGEEMKEMKDAERMIKRGRGRLEDWRRVIKSARERNIERKMRDGVNERKRL